MTAKAMAKAKNNQRPVLAAKFAPSAISTRSKVSRPKSSRASIAVAMSPTSINAEPNMVYKKNFVAA